MGSPAIRSISYRGLMFLTGAKSYLPSTRVRKTMSTSSRLLEEKVTLPSSGQTIHYNISGSGGHPVLLLPGALGTAKTDFPPQIDPEEGLVAAAPNVLKVVGWDPPGYGQSTPPARTFPLDFFDRDARDAVELMDLLLQSSEDKRFSLLGWSDGGITALAIAGTYPERIRRMVLWGSNSFISAKDMEMVESVRDVSKWSERMRKPMEDVYGVRGFAELWNQWVDAYKDIFEQKEGKAVTQEQLERITCPTLVIHGDKDAMVDPVHPGFLKDKIKGSILHRFPDGKHNLHLKYKDEFNRMVVDFLARE